MVTKKRQSNNRCIGNISYCATIRISDSPLWLQGRSMVWKRILALPVLVIMAITVAAQSPVSKDAAREVVDRMKIVAEARRKMGLDAPSWYALERYEDKLEILLDQKNQKTLTCGLISWSSFTTASFDGRVPDVGNAEEFPPGSLVDWLYHYSVPLVAKVVDGSLEYQDAVSETTTECLRHRYVYVALHDTPMHEIVVGEAEACLRGGPCPGQQRDDEFGDDDSMYDDE